MHAQPPAGYHLAPHSRRGAWTDGRGRYWYPDVGEVSALHHADAAHAETRRLRAEGHGALADLHHAEAEALHGPEEAHAAPERAALVELSDADKARARGEAKAAERARAVAEHKGPTQHLRDELAQPFHGGWITFGPLAGAVHGSRAVVAMVYDAEGRLIGKTGASNSAHNAMQAAGRFATAIKARAEGKPEPAKPEPAKPEPPPAPEPEHVIQGREADARLREHLTAMDAHEKAGNKAAFEAHGKAARAWADVKRIGAPVSVAIAESFNAERASRPAAPAPESVEPAKARRVKIALRVNAMIGSHYAAMEDGRLPPEAHLAHHAAAQAWRAVEDGKGTVEAAEAATAHAASIKAPEVKREHVRAEGSKLPEVGADAKARARHFAAAEYHRGAAEKAEPAEAALHREAAEAHDLAEQDPARHGAAAHEASAKVTSPERARLAAVAAPAAAEPPPVTPAAAAPAPAAEPRSGADAIRASADVAKRLREGTITPEELREAWAAHDQGREGVRARFMGMKVDALRLIAGRMAVVHGNRKEDYVRGILNALDHRFHPSDVLAHAGSVRDAVHRDIQGVTAESLAEYAGKHAKARAERAAQEAKVAEPQTAEDFEARIARHGRASLTPEQRAKADDLIAERDRKRREAKPAPAAPAPERAKLVAAASGGPGFTLHAGTHTTKGHPIWTVAMGERVPAEEYERLKAAAKAGGGYYSWYKDKGAIPGFIFKDEAAARAFMGAQGGAAAAPGPEVDATPTPDAEEAAPALPRGAKARAEKLREVAESTRERAEATLGADRKVNTARRADMAANVEGRARGELDTAAVLHELADRHEAGTLRHLGDVTSKAHVEHLDQLLRAASYDRPGGFVKDAPPDVEHLKPRRIQATTHGAHLRSLAEAYDALPNKRGLAKAGALARTLASLHVDGPQTLSDADAETLRPLVERLAADPKARWSTREIGEALADARRLRRMGIHTPEDARAALREYQEVVDAALARGKPKAGPDRAEQIRRELIGVKIPGFFATPKGLAAEVVRDADIRPGHRVLEPSAGSGALARAVREAHPGASLDVIEQAPKLREYLREQGFNLIHHDHTEHKAPDTYDRIVMNPPFEQGADADHVRAAYDKLAPGGRMVAIMGEGSFFRGDKKAEGFRGWLDSVGGTSERLPEGSFTESGTGVSTRKVIVEKPHTLRSYMEDRGATEPDIKAAEAHGVDADGWRARAEGVGNRAHHAVRDFNAAERRGGTRPADIRAAIPSEHPSRPSPIVEAIERAKLREAAEKPVTLSERPRSALKAWGDRDTIEWEPGVESRPDRVTLRRGDRAVAVDPYTRMVYGGVITGISHGRKGDSHGDPKIRLSGSSVEHILPAVYTEAEAKARGYVVGQKVPK